jgi:hypothetical protein
MKLQTALLLSSKKQAVQKMSTGGLYPRYQLLVTKASGEHGILFTLGISCITYLEKEAAKKAGKGWGTPVIKAVHFEESFESLEVLVEFLQGYEIKANEGWKSVEDEEQPGTE